jgi:hypothetical protein
LQRLERGGSLIEIGHRLRLLAKQFPTSRDRNRLPLLIRVFDVLHGHPCELDADICAGVECARTRRHDAGALMSDERGCGRDADTNTRDVTSGAVIASGQLARSIKLLAGEAATLP